MRHMLRILASVCGVVWFAAAAQARVDITVDLSDQQMHVSSATGDYVWPISSARAGFSTPRGSYGVQRMEVMHRSHKYQNSPMPHSLFFKGGYAIHGTYSVASLGRPASHGCIRIAPENAAALYQVVEAEGARITITGTVVAPTSLEAARSRRRIYAQSRTGAAPRLRGTEEPDNVLGYAALQDVIQQHWWLDPAGL